MDEKDSRNHPMEDHRPWGNFTVLSDRPDHKVKRITVYPGKRLSYQRHRMRSEHWHVVAGSAVVTLDGKDLPLGPGESVDIAVGAAHRVANPHRHQSRETGNVDRRATPKLDCGNPPPY